MTARQLAGLFALAATPAQFAVAAIVIKYKARVAVSVGLRGTSDWKNPFSVEADRHHTTGRASRWRGARQSETAVDRRGEALL